MDGFGCCYKEQVIELDDKSDIGGRKRSVASDILMVIKSMWRWPFPEWIFWESDRFRGVGAGWEWGEIRLNVLVCVWVDLVIAKVGSWLYGKQRRGLCLICKCWVICIHMSISDDHVWDPLGNKYRTESQRRRNCKGSISLLMTECRGMNL